MKKKPEHKQSEGFYVRLTKNQAKELRKMVRFHKPKISIGEYIRKQLMTAMYPF
jgi:hypothetical protein